MFRCNLPPALLADCLGSFTCHWGNRGWNGHRIRISTQSWLWRRKFSHRSCQDSNSLPFDHKSHALTNKLSRLSTCGHDQKCASSYWSYSIAMDYNGTQYILYKSQSFWQHCERVDLFIFWQRCEWVFRLTLGVNGYSSYHNIVKGLPTYLLPRNFILR